MNTPEQHDGWFCVPDRQRFSSPNARKWLELAPTVATGYHRLPFGSHGKEGVSGSSPEEGSDESPATAGLLLSCFAALRPACSSMA